MKDYYKVMGLTREAAGEEIKKAYRSLARQYNPDRNQGDPVYENLNLCTIKKMGMMIWSRFSVGLLVGV